MVLPSDFISANEQQVAARVIDGEAVLIHLGTGVYYSLRTTGAFIWSLVERRPSIGEIVRSVGEHYEVSEVEATRDVLRLCGDLCAEGLAVTSSVGPTHTVVAPKASDKRLPYEAPAIEKYTDMAEMFALDPPLPGLSQTSTPSSER